MLATNPSSVKHRRFQQREPPLPQSRPASYRKLQEARQRGMRRIAWVWFAGFGAWLFAGVLRLRSGDIAHGQIALLVSAMFLAAALFYRYQRR